VAVDRGAAHAERRGDCRHRVLPGAVHLLGHLKLLDHEGVAGAQLVEDQGEGGPVGAGAAGGLSERPVAAGGLQRVDLELGLLVDGGDAA
jgi:hypothetical protein